MMKRVTKEQAIRAFNKGKEIICNDMIRGYVITYKKSYEIDEDFDNVRGQWFIKEGENKSC